MRSELSDFFDWWLATLRRFGEHPERPSSIALLSPCDTPALCPVRDRSSSVLLFAARSPSFCSSRI